MDVDKLIMLVRDRGEIYDPEHPKHRNRDYIAKAWKSIAQELQTTDTEAKAKWRNLRSNYMREKRRLGSILPGSSAEKRMWSYYPVLSFLDNSLQHRETNENVSEVDPDEKSQVMENVVCDYDNYDSDQMQTDLNPIIEISNTISTNIIPSENVDIITRNSFVPKKRKKLFHQRDDIDRMYLKHLERISLAVQEPDDPDLLFLKSLLPMISKLGPVQNLKFKSEFLQLLKNKMSVSVTPVQLYSTSVENISFSKKITQEQHTANLIEYQSQFNSSTEAPSLNFDKNFVRAMSSIHTANQPEIHEMPLSAITRPLPLMVDETKVQSIAETLMDPTKEHSVPPIDILWITGREGGNYYYSFGGCHRYAAHKKLQKDTIKVKLVKSTVNDLKVYLGSSVPDLK